MSDGTHGPCLYGQRGGAQVWQLAPSVYVIRRLRFSCISYETIGVASTLERAIVIAKAHTLERKTVSDESKAQALRLHAAGVCRQHIANQLGIDRRTVKRICTGH